MLFTFKSVRTHLNILFLLMAVLPLLASVSVIYLQRVESIKQAAFQKLIVIRDLKVSQLNLWLVEKTGDIALLAEVSAVRSLKKHLALENSYHIETEKIHEVRENFKARIKNYNDYEEIFLISAQTGKVVISSRESSEGHDYSKNSFFTTPLETNDFFIKDIHYSKTLNKPALTFSTPVFALEANKDLIGILVARVHLNQSLYSLLLERPGMGETGETLIVNKEAIALNELRWYENAPMKLKIESFPSVQASRGETGIIESEDYRKKKVLAAYTYIPRTRWGFVAKQDIDEIYKPITKLIKNILNIIGYSCFFVFVAAFIISKRITAPLRSMTAIADKLQAGDFSVRNRLKRSDEFGDLGSSIDNMANTLTSQVELQESVSGVTAAVVASKEVSVFAKKILNILVKNTGSGLGAFHLLEKDRNNYVSVAAVGASAELLAPISAQQPEGEISKAIISQEICHLQRISEDTFFQLKSFSGSIIPKEVITIPLVNDSQVEAVISLASFTGYSTLHLQIIKTAWNVLNTGHINLLTNEKLQSMALSIQKTNHELEEQKIELQRQSDELQEQNIELEAQKLQVEEATRLKSEFLSNMSHELRTPLNSIMALSKVLILETKDTFDEEQNNYLEVISRNGQKLLKLINDILDLSKIEAGGADLDPKLVSIRRVLGNIIEGFEVICRDKNIHISLDIAGNLPHVESDENRVHQILQNIISNAVKFTLEGGVSISANSDEKNIFITIKDTGVGISEDHLPFIFGEFRQADGSSSRSFEGTGLGLAIAKKSAALLNAEITVTSIHGQGSCFSIRLPIAWGGAKYHTIDSDTINVLSPFEVGRKVVLVVDDEPETARIISNYLEDAGYSTITAFTGKEALILARSHKLFAITMDIIMPDIDGWEIIQKLKADPQTATIPVIIVSMSKDQQTGYALGGVDFIAKPVSKNQLLTAFDKLHRVNIHSAMVVDDNVIDRKNIVRMFAGAKTEVIEAEGGIRCLELLEEAIPDVIILDLKMPDMSGFEVLEKLRESPVTQGVPVLIVTAKDVTPSEKSLLNRHMAPVLEKTDLTLNTFWLKLRDQLMDLERPPTHTNSKTEGPEKKNILIVEDNPETVIQVKYVLEKEGYCVSSASNGKGALGLIDQKIPDGVILDLMMPEIDGFEVLEEIRGSELTASLPVLILTAKDLTKDDLNRLSHNNIQQLVQKGDINLNSLLFKVKLMLGNQPRLPLSQPYNSLTDMSVETNDHGLPVEPNEGAHVVLIVEDNPDNMITLKAILKKQYTLLEAEDGEEGLKKAIHYKPDLIFLDISLPKMDGYDVVRCIRKEPIIKNIPVVALTAHAMKGDEDKVRAAGCDDYISKPIDPEMIYKSLKKWLPEQ